MWSEKLNNKIKQASESHIPEYDESAWVKMVALLNKHLPSKKDGRKKLLYIFFLCCFIICGTLLLNKEWSSKLFDQDLKTTKEKSIISDEKKLKIDSKNTLSSKYPKAVKNLAHSNRLDKKNITVLSKTDRRNLPSLVSDQPVQNPIAVNKDENKRQEHEKENVKNRWLPDNNNKMQDKTELSLQNQNETLITSPVISQEQIMKDSLDNQVEANKPIESILPGIVLQKKPEKKSILSRFNFSASAGTDVSGIGLNDPGKATISYGAGVGYAISKRFLIKSGLYIADKIYSSGPEYYKPTTGYWATVDLKKIDADCKVYEIPLTLYYSFKEKKHHHWFAALGASSYLMKKEAYHFLYKNQAGNMVYRDWSLKNENKHYFSVITLSGGYSYRLNKTFSLMAEPYVKAPVQGLGYGKVKLNSAGILFTINATPF
ncbi:MAG: PorT family protein [Bacteroidota bacterium]|nr:PorT family protein [Bacteroidota bacterium]